MDSMPENMNMNDFVNYKYAPINSVDAEHSILTFIVLLADNKNRSV